MSSLIRSLFFSLFSAHSSSTMNTSALPSESQFAFDVPLLHPALLSALAALLVTSLFLALRPRYRNLPPGPKPHLFYGNARDMPPTRYVRAGVRGETKLMLKHTLANMQALGQAGGMGKAAWTDLYIVDICKTHHHRLIGKDRQRPAGQTVQHLLVATSLRNRW